MCTFACVGMCINCLLRPIVSKDDNNNPTVMIAACVTVGVLVAALVIFILLYVMKKRSMKCVPGCFCVN